PGDMKDLMNKVTEARKAAEANLIVRREETAAMRSQANTARLLEGNPTLMRLRELEALEKVASNAKLNVVLGEKGLAEKIVNLVGRDRGTCRQGGSPGFCTQRRLRELDLLEAMVRGRHRAVVRQRLVLS